MKIYVAGASAEMPLIEDYIRRLRDAGHTITHDWTADVRAAGDASPADPLTRSDAARKDLQGVRDSEATWVLKPAPTSTSTGAWVELGYGHGLKDERARQEGTSRANVRPLLVVSGSSRKCIFADEHERLADREFQEHEEAFAFLLRLGEKLAEPREAP